MDRSIDVSKENWMSVPAFGDWEKLQGMPDYSMDFTKIRENRKQSKCDYSRMSVGKEADLLSQYNTPLADAPPVILRAKQRSPGRKTLMSYFACCSSK